MSRNHSHPRGCEEFLKMGSDVQKEIENGRGSVQMMWIVGAENITISW